jgi:phytoene desaturase
MGGMSRVIDALVSIAQKWGVRFRYNAPVRQIDVNGRRATGVTLADGLQLKADAVVANADLPYVYRNLLPDDGTADRLDRKRYSCSAMMFCWGVDKRYPQLQPHHLFFAADIRQNYKNVTKDLIVSDDPSFYLHAPGRLDPSMAPEGQDTLTVVVPVGHLNEAAPQDWTALQKRTRQVVLERLAEFGLKDLEKHIKFEICYTPLDWQARFNLVKGASHGLSHNLMQMGYFRPHNRHARYRNLYFVGASTHPGTGLPTVLVSARLVTERLLQDAEPAQLASIQRPVAALSQ